MPRHSRSDTGGASRVGGIPVKNKPAISSVKHSITYTAEGTVATQLLSISKTADTGANQTIQSEDPSEVRVTNDGQTPVSYTHLTLPTNREV